MFVLDSQVQNLKIQKGFILAIIIELFCSQIFRNRSLYCMQLILQPYVNKAICNGGHFENGYHFEPFTAISHFGSKTHSIFLIRSS